MSQEYHAGYTDFVTSPMQLSGYRFFVFVLNFIYLTVPCLGCGMWDLVPWQGIEPRTPVLETWSINHWATREVHQDTVDFFFFFLAVPGLRCCMGFSLVVTSSGNSSCGAQASHRGGFCCCGAQALGNVGFSSCGTCGFHTPWDK